MPLRTIKIRQPIFIENNKKAANHLYLISTYTFLIKVLLINFKNNLEIYLFSCNKSENKIYKIPTPNSLS